MKLGIIGSRSFYDLPCMLKVLVALGTQLQWKPEEPLLIVSGGGRGADTCAEALAKHLELPTEIFRAEWDKYGKSAGYKRNPLIAGASDVILAFWNGKSKGTLNTMQIALKQNKSVYVFNTVTEELYQYIES